MTAVRPRVLHVGKFYPPYKGGMETHLETLCLGLRPHVDLRVVVANTERRRLDEVIDQIPVTRLGTLVNLGAAPYTPGLGRFIRREDADIVHLHFPHPTAILAYLRSGHQGRLIVTYHSDIVRQRVLGLAFRPILHRALSRASAIICTSPDYVASSPVLTAHRERCHVLPFGIATDRFARVDDEEVRRIRGRHGDRLVLAVGRLVSYKGFEYLIRAMAEIRGRLVLVGDGPLRGALEQLAREIGVAERVAFLKRVDDVNPYYHAADVFALPSVARSEAFGLVQLEAMAAGIPVVNTKLASGVPYVSPHGVTGFTVPPGDPGAMARAITRLLDDPSLRRQLGSTGRTRARETFGVHAMVQQTLAVYHAALKAPRGEPIDAPVRSGHEVDHRAPVVVSDASTSPNRLDSTS
jgi:glycosyltransferase involved in cell wall biosynthesis